MLNVSYRTGQDIAHHRSAENEAWTKYEEALQKYTTRFSHDQWKRHRAELRRCRELSRKAELSHVWEFYRIEKITKSKAMHKLQDKAMDHFWEYYTLTRRSELALILS